MTESIQHTIESHGLHPLSDTITSERNARGGNVHDVAALAALRSAPIEELAPCFRGPRRKLEQSRALEKESNAETEELNRELMRLNYGRQQETASRINLAALEGAFEKNTAECATDIAGQWSVLCRQGHALASLHRIVADRLVAERMVKILPGLIATERKALEKLTSELDALAKKFE